MCKNALCEHLPFLETSFQLSTLWKYIRLNLYLKKSLPDCLVSQKLTAPPRFWGKYPGGLEQVSEGGVRLYSRLPASKEQEGALQITWPSPQRIHKLTNTPSIQVLYSMHGFLGFWFIQKPYLHSPHLWF